MRKKNNHSGGGRHQNRGRGKYRSGGNDSQSLGRQKKHATTQRDKYQNMARDAQGNGDRVDMEYYLQHVEHYTRVLNDIAEKEGANKEQADTDNNEEMSDEAGNLKEADASGDADTGADDDANAKPKKAAAKPRSKGRAPSRAKGPNDNKEEIPLPAGVIPEADGEAANAS